MTADQYDAGHKKAAESGWTLVRHRAGNPTPETFDARDDLLGTLVAGSDPLFDVGAAALVASRSRGTAPLALPINQEATRRCCRPVSSARQLRAEDRPGNNAGLDPASASPLRRFNPRPDGASPARWRYTAAP